MRTSSTRPTRVIAPLALLLLLAPALPSARAQDTPSWNKAKATPKPPVTKPKPVVTRPKAKPKPRPVVKREPAPPARPQLSAQYRVLKVNDNDTQVEVSPVTVFNRGDRLRLAVKSEQDVYLFVIHQRGVGQTGRIYVPDSQINGGQNFLKSGAEFVIPSGCPAGGRPSACSYQVDASGGQEVFTIIFSRTPTFDLLDEAAASGGVTQRALDALTSGLSQRVDDAARGDSVFARRYRNLGPRSPDQLVVRFILNKRS